MSKTTEDRLEYIFENVNNWLKFAEAKNGALLALNLICIMKAAEKLGKIDNDVLCIFIIFFLFFSLLSLLCCLASYMPQLLPPKNVRHLLKIFKKREDTNLLYFGDLSQISAEELLKKLKTLTPSLPEVSEENTYEKYFAEQIVCNSVISAVKYQFFTISIWLTATAFLTPFISVSLVYFFFLAKNKE